MVRAVRCANPARELKPASGVIAPALLSLLCVAPAAIAAPGDPYCTLPGELVTQDAAGDATFIVAPEAIPGHDVLDVRIAEAPSADGIDRISFTLTIAQTAPAFTPMSSYEVEFKLADGVERFVRFVPYPVPSEAVVFAGQDLMFSYGQRGVDPTTGNGTFSIDGPADPASTASEDGTITIVLTLDTLPIDGLGEHLVDVAGIAQHNYAGGATLDVDNSDAPGFYQIRGSASCTDGAKGLLGTNIGAISPFLIALLGLAGLARVRRRI